MSTNKLEMKLKPGKPRRHGGYSFLTKGELPESRAYLLRYLSNVRDGLVKDIGGSEDSLSTAQVILVDRVVTLLGVIRCIEEHVRETSVMQGNELAPSLRHSYITYNNSLRLILTELGIEKRDGDRMLSPLEYIQGKEAKGG